MLIKKLLRNITLHNLFFISLQSIIQNYYINIFAEISKNLKGNLVN